jgi:hypothetical protein
VYDARMEMSAWMLGVGIVGGAVYLLLHSLFRGARATEFDAGAVSQSWITEHRDERHN